MRYVQIIHPTGLDFGDATLSSKMNMQYMTGVDNDQNHAFWRSPSLRSEIKRLFQAHFLEDLKPTSD